MTDDNRFFMQLFVENIGDFDTPQMQLSFVNIFLTLTLRVLSKWKVISKSAIVKQSDFFQLKESLFIISLRSTDNFIILLTTLSEEGKIKKKIETLIFKLK